MSSSLEYELIGDIAKRRFGISEIIEKHFGSNCLKKRRGFKIQTLEMACILFGVDQKALLQEIFCVAPSPGGIPGERSGNV